MANDPQKRALLDQLTDEANAPQPPIPAPLAPALADASATDPGSISNLESIADSPDTLRAGIDATKAEDTQPSFLSKLKDFAGGAIGVENPNSSPAAGKGAKLAQVIGKVGNALALAGGTPEQKQIAEENLQTPLKVASLQNEANYRNAMVGINSRKNDINQQNADTKEDVATKATIPTAEAKETNLEADTAKKQYELEVMKQGMFPVDPVTAQLVGRPDLAGKPVSAALWKGFNSVLQARGLKTTDLGPGNPNDPQSGGLWITDRAGNKIHQMSTVSPSVARANAILERNYHPVNDAHGNIVGYMNPSTRHFVTPSQMNNVAGGQSLEDAVGGSVIPPKPTTSMLTQGQMAQTVIDQIPTINSEISSIVDKIGPGEGRWNDFWVNKGGLNDPDYARLNQDLKFFATAMAKAHFGASASTQIVDALMHDFGQAQSAGDLISRVQSADSWMNGYASFAGGRNAHSTNVPKSPTNRPPLGSFEH